MSAAAAVPPPWQAAQQALLGLHAAIAAAHQSGLESIGRDDAEPFIGLVADLSRALERNLPTLQAAALSGPMPPATAALLQQVGQELQALLALNTKLSARTQRALDALFPADHVKAYSRLAGRANPFSGPLASGNGGGYLKA